MKNNSMVSLENQLARLLECDILPEKSYLAGGTAVYFYLKHRVSIDLDFFTPTSFNSDHLVQKIRNCFGDVQVELMQEKTLILFVSKEKVKFSLFMLPYQNLRENRPFALRNNIVCPLASLDDIEAMKAVAISQRGSAKDFIDMYRLVGKTGHGYNDILQAVIKKYKQDDSYEYQLKTSFVYFEDAEKEAPKILMIGENGEISPLKSKEWEHIKKFFARFIQ